MDGLDETSVRREHLSGLLSDLHVALKSGASVQKNASDIVYVVQRCKIVERL